MDNLNGQHNGKSGPACKTPEMSCEGVQNGHNEDQDVSAKACHPIKSYYEGDPQCAASPATVAKRVRRERVRMCAVIGAEEQLRREQSEKRRSIAAEEKLARMENEKQLRLARKCVPPWVAQSHDSKLAT
eukprot:SAG31_NODE_4213_length_3461_cov_1.715645_5_plen_130_part_00